MKKRKVLSSLLAVVLLLGLAAPGASAAQAADGAEEEALTSVWTDGEDAAPAAVDLGTLSNIAADAEVTTSTPATGEWLDAIDPVGNLVDENYDTNFRWINKAISTYITETGEEPWVNLSFGENRRIGGFKISVQKNDNEGTQKYSYHILGKASGDSEYTELFSGEATKASNNFSKTYTLSDMTEYSEIRVAFTNQSDAIWPIFSEIEVFGEAKTVPPTPEDPDRLINVAPESAITVPSNESGAGKITDGDIGTFWASSDGRWPADIDFALPGNLLVQRVEVDFERFDDRTFDLTVSRAVNSVTSDYEQLGAKNGHDVNSTYVLKLDEAQRMTHVRISLRGTNGQAWPAIAEARIYAVDEQINLDDYDNITSYAGEPTTGSNYKEWDFGSNQQVVGFRAALAEGASAVVKGKMKRDAGWTTYVAQLQSGDNVLSFPAGMSAVRVELDDPSQLTGFQIFGTYTAPVTDDESVAFGKPTHGNFSTATTYQVNDGDKNTFWQPDMYPAYVDIDLGANYDLTELQVFTAKTGCTEYTLYTSMNGRDFDLAASKLDDSPCPDGGDTHTVSETARYLRVYLEYYSENARPQLREVRAVGTLSADQTDHTAACQDVTPFDQTDYAAPITDAETIDAVKGIITRQVGADYADWFTFALEDQANGYDYFTLSDKGGKVKVTGNNGVSLATGVNHYLKYFCNVHISQVGKQVDMPANIVPINGTVHKETKYPVRYAYNYCTHSYTMSFWNEEEWQNELDWQALNGVNVVLDITGQEEVWREFLMSEEIGYTHQEAKDFLAGPGYYAWAYMANLTGFGGPIHDSFLTERVELARKNQRFMRVLGMEPVLQAFSGMVPVDITTHDPDAAVIPQGVWCSFQRPTMLKTDTATYDEYARLFYAAQERVLGGAKYYATDPFHEGGTTGGMSPATVSSALLDSLLEFDSDAVWVIQSWQGNPSNGLLDGLRQGTDRREHALILDLWAEHSPHNNESGNGYGTDTDGDGIKEFSDTPWVWCMLNNFGGRMGLHGHLDALQENIPAAANSAQHMAGIGMSPEGAQENPVLYDFLFETIWADDASQDLPVIDLEQWLKDYARRRYGAESANAEEALAIMSETVYKSSLNMAGQGSPESVVNARPALSIGAASTWGNSSIAYSKTRLEQAAQLLLADYDTLSASDAYLYDVADVLKQVLSNSAQEIHRKMAAAYRSGNADEFAALAEKFLALIDLEEQVLGTRSEFTFGKWTGGAVKMAENADDFTKRLYLRNAKALVTTWGSIQQCNAGGLKDYSNRQWAGLTEDYYKVRWTAWIDACKENLAQGSTAEPGFNWFAWEWAYARDQKLYSSKTNDENLKTLGAQVLADYSVQDPLGGKDLDPFVMTVKAGSEETVQEDNAAGNALDRDSSTIWHTDWNNSPAATNWIAFDLGSKYAVDGLRYLPRQDGNPNGLITGYEVYVSTDDAAWAALDSGSAWPASPAGWTKAASSADSSAWTNDSSWKEASFAAKMARYVVLKATSTNGGSFCSAAEIRVTADSTVTPAAAVKVFKDGTAVDADTELKVYTNADHPSHSLTLTAQVEPEDATNKNVKWLRTEVTGKVTLSRGANNTLTVTAIHNDAETNVGPVELNIYAESDESIKQTITVKVVRMLENPVTISIQGVNDPTAAPQFGQTLEADINQLKMTDAGKQALSYQWKRTKNGSTTNIGTNSKTYTLTQADIGAAISVDVAANPATFYEGARSAARAQAVVKADGPSIPGSTISGVKTTTAANNDGRITGFGADFAKYEYKAKDAASWTAVTAAEVTGLTNGEYQVRIKATDTHKAGAPINVTVPAYDTDYKKVNIASDLVNGAITRDHPQADPGATITLTIRPDTGYELAAITVTGAGGSVTLSGEGNTRTFTMPNEDVTVSATFRKLKFTIDHSGLVNIKCSKDAEGVLDDHKVEYGDTAAITLVPDEGCALPAAENIEITNANGDKITGWTIDNNGTITITGGVTSDLTIKATGIVKTYVVNFTLSTGLSAPDAARSVAHKAAYSGTLVAAEGYKLPKSISVTMGGAVFEDFTYENGVLTIAAGKITGNLVIKADGVAVVPVAGVTLDKTSLSLTEGQTEILTAAITPAGADNKAVTWTSSNEAAATVDEDGNVTAVAEGTATITVTTEDGGKTASCAVTVTPSAALIPGTPGKPSTGTTVEKNDDGSTTTTVTDKKTGTVTETTEKPDGSKEIKETKKDGTVTETIEKTDGSKEVVESKPDGTVTETKTDTEGAKTEKITDAEKNVVITVTDKEGEVLAKVELPAEIPAPETRFEDVPEGHWADEAIHNMAALEVVKGVGENEYNMSGSMKRGDLALLLSRMSNAGTDYEAKFDDVPAGKYYANGVAWAAKAGIVTGRSEELFKPEDTITRGELAVMLYRYASLLKMDIEADASALDAFTDGGSTAGWAADGVAWCVKNGIMQGKGNNILDSKSNVTRAEVAVMLQRFTNLMK